ncbi:MAG: restriction endonuclease subunit S [Clostridia bacterium]|nr:restriction endonuclease subunit S [Clostridia bacterium]MBR0414207.1 restriction endonuclease subunit S [Clostridia bacterium]
MVNTSLAVNKQADDALKVVINEAPLKWCSVSLSDVVNRGKRLEASVFDVEAKQALLAVSKCKYPPSKLISKDGPVLKAHYGARLKRRYVLKSTPGSIGFIGSSEMLDIYPQPIKFMVSNETTNALKVKNGTVLISRSGTIGNVTFVNKTLEKMFVSEHAMRLECGETPGYVYTYLKSKTGKAIVCSNIYGAVVQQIEPEHLATVPIPDAPDDIKKRINDLIVKSYDLRDESNDLIDEATALLIKELNLPPIEEFEVNDFKKNAPVETFNVKLSDLSGRADASYHLPIVDAIIEHLKQNAEEVTTIGDSRISSDVVLPGRFKRVYVEEGHGRVLFGGKQLYELDPSNKKYISSSKHDKRIVEQLEISQNTTLITRSGTIGKVAMVPEHWEHWVASEHIIRVVPANNEIAGYINIYLASDYGHQLITRFTYGSVVDEVDDNHIRQIPIPLLKDKNVQKQINDLALLANQKRYEAYCLEQEALRIMDEEVIFAKQGRT